VVPEDSVISLAITVFDAETAVNDLQVTGTSSNTNVVAANGIAITSTGGARTVTITPLLNVSGTSLITLVVADTDGHRSTNTFNVTFTAANDAPTITTITDKTTSEDIPTDAIPFTVGDVETAAANLVVTGFTSNTNIVTEANIGFGGSEANRFVVVRPVLDATGDANITVRVTDANGAFSSTTFKLTVGAIGDGPTISAIADQTTAEDTASPLLQFTVTDNDPPQGNVVLTATSSNTGLVPNNNIFVGASGNLRTMTLIPAANQSGATIITVVVRDAGNNLSSTSTFTLTVTPGNDLPTISAIANQTIQEDETTAPIPYTVSDSETPVASLVFTKSSSNTQVIPTASVVLGGTGANRTVTVTGAPNQSGFSDVTITVIDANDGRASATFRVTVLEDIDPPTISDLTDRTTPEGTPATLNFTVSDSETAASNLIVTASSGNTALLPNANLVVSGSGTVRTLTATPVSGVSGSATVTVTVVDGSNASASDSFVLTVTEINRNDFNGDGLSDIVFQDQNGFLAAWFMNGETRLSTLFFNPNNSGDPRWRVVGTGDFNSDGDGDLLFQHQDGTLSVWYLDGINLTGNALLNPSHAGDAAWRVVATSDFNLDGKRDILFQHNSGELAIWYMNGVNLLSNVLTSPSNTGDSRWLAVGAADVDKDSRPDIIFQHTDGTLAVWFMNGQTRVDFDVLNPENPGPNWRVSAVGNYDAGVQNDLILQGINGDMQVWFMNGTHGEIRRLLNPPNAGVDWFVVGPK